MTMFEIHHFALDFPTLKTIRMIVSVILGVWVLPQLPIFLWKLLTGNYTFIKTKGQPGTLARAFMPPPAWVDGAFEEIEQAQRSENGRAEGKPASPDPHRPITVEIGANGAFKLDVPEHAFDT
jgi:hypothetical protein